MRNPDRIHEALNLIKEIWLRDPDLRLNQLIYSLQYDYSNKNGGIGRVTQNSPNALQIIGFDLFNLEDDKFIEYLHTKSAHNNKQNE